MLAKETKVYRDTVLFVDELMKVTINFKREYRRTLAERLENKSLELIDYIVLANSSIEQRASYLQRFTVCYNLAEEFFSYKFDSTETWLGRSMAAAEEAQDPHLITKAEILLAEFTRAGIPAAVIGYALKSNDRLLYSQNVVRYLDRPPGIHRKEDT